MHMSRWAIVLMATGVLAACSQGPGDDEFMQACLVDQAGQQNKEEMCRCVASAAKEDLPSEHYQAMVLNMQGKKQEAEALLSAVSMEQRAEFGMKQFEIVGKCGGMQ